MTAEDLIVLRCKKCGDTFATHESDVPACRSCGSTELDVAHEPLL